jgi:PEP-CTERM motif
MKRLALALCLVFAAASSGWAQSSVWGNDAQGYAPATIHQIDKTTGAELNTFSGVDGNGRGIVVVGNIVYYTMVDDPVIHEMNATTGADMGGITTSVASMSTIAWDGSAFWTSDYAGTNQAFRIGLDGTVNKTITLSNASGFMDGMEYFDGKLIANRCDACGVYDIYDTNGNLLQSAFIDTGGQSTGIAYDGTDFFVSYIFGNALGVYDGTGSFVRQVDLTGSHLIEDLSVDYAQRADTGGGNAVPEPSTILLLGTGLMGIGGALRRRRLFAGGE